MCMFRWTQLFTLDSLVSATSHSWSNRCHLFWSHPPQTCPLQHWLHPFFPSHPEVHCSRSCHRLETSSHLPWSGDLCDKNGHNRPPPTMWTCTFRHLWAVVIMGGRHRGEGENLAHCIVSGGGGEAQGFCQSLQGREVQSPLNLQASVTLCRRNRTFCMQ